MKPWMVRETWILILAVRRWLMAVQTSPSLTDEEWNVFNAFTRLWADIEEEEWKATGHKHLPARQTQRVVRDMAEEVM